MWIYEIDDGKLVSPEGETAGFGYSGGGHGKNDPEDEALRGVGPIPEGLWRVCPPFFHEHAGPYTLRLLPEPGTKTFGRSGFLIHGDSLRDPGTASQGCIVLPRELRMEIWESGDHDLMVVSRVKKDEVNLA